MACPAYASVSVVTPPAVNAPPVVPLGEIHDIVVLVGRFSTLSHDLPFGKSIASPDHDDWKTPE
jgi:hypothetical protein